MSLSANERAVLSLTSNQRAGRRHPELIVPVSDGVQEVFTFLSLLIKVKQTVHQREVVRIILGNCRIRKNVFLGNLVITADRREEAYLTLNITFPHSAQQIFTCISLKLEILEADFCRLNITFPCVWSHCGGSLVTVPLLSPGVAGVTRSPELPVSPGQAAECLMKTGNILILDQVASF